MNLNIEKITKDLNRARSKYESHLSAIELKIKPYVKFDFSIIYQPSDGFVVLNYKTSDNYLLSDCLMVIMEEGELTAENAQ